MNIDTNIICNAIVILEQDIDEAFAAGEIGLAEVRLSVLARMHRDLVEHIAE